MFKERFGFYGHAIGNDRFCLKVSICILAVCHVNNLDFDTLIVLRMHLNPLPSSFPAIELVT